MKARSIRSRFAILWLTAALLLAGVLTGGVPPVRGATVSGTVSGTTPAATANDPTPLLTYATNHQELPPAYDPDAQSQIQKQVSQRQFDVSRNSPPETDCVHTLGAKRFANLFEDLGFAYSRAGDDGKAVEAYSKAIACNPRAAYLHTDRAASLLDMSHYDEARLELQREVTLGHGDFSVYSLLAQLDFAQNRWQDAIGHARLAATEAPSSEQAAYWQCFLWLAQKHAGIADPTLINRKPADSWPAPILDSLRGKLSEGELTEAVAAERDGHRQREILTEALFYTAHKHLVDNQVSEARRYFTAAAALQVPYFIEHHLALAELENLRQAGR